MPGSLTSRHSDTRLPRSPYDRRPRPDPRLFIRPIDTPSGANETYDRAHDGLYVLRAGDTMTGALVINGSATGSVQHVVRGASGQTADLQQWNSFGGTVLVKVSAAGILQWGGASGSFLGSSGELWCTGAAYGGIFYHGLFAVSGAATSGVNSHLVMIGDSGSGTPAYMALKNFRNVTDAVTDVWNMSLGGAAGNLSIKNAVAGTIPIEVQANASQSVDVFKTKSSGGTAWVRIQSNGRLTCQNGVAIDEFSSDGTMAGYSDLAVPTEKAVVDYVGASISAIVIPTETTPVSLIFTFSEATTKNTSCRGLVDQKSDNARFRVPDDFNFTITSGSLSFKTGAAAGTYDVSLVSYDGTTETELINITTTNTSTWTRTSSGFLMSEGGLFSYGGTAEINIGWRNKNSVSALTADFHCAIVNGVLYR